MQRSHGASRTSVPHVRQLVQTPAAGAATTWLGEPSRSRSACSTASSSGVLGRSCRFPAAVTAVSQPVALRTNISSPPPSASSSPSTSEPFSTLPTHPPPPRALPSLGSAFTGRRAVAVYITANGTGWMPRTAQARRAADRTACSFGSIGL